MREFETEQEAIAALKIAGYQVVNEPSGVFAKNGHKVKVVRDSWKAKYFIAQYGNNA